MPATRTEPAPPTRARPARGRRWPRRLAIAAAVLVLLGVALHLALDPLVSWRTRLVLNELQGYRGTFSDVKVSLRDLSYRIHDLELQKVSSGGDALPFFEVRKAEVGLYWKELVRGHVVGAIRFEGPRLNLIAAKAERRQQGDADDAEAAGLQLTKLAPLRVDRFEVQDGEVVFVDRSSPRGSRLRLHGVEATIENFATRPALSRGEPTVLALRGTLQRTGKVSLFATSDPLAKSLTFAGQAQVTGLRFVELRELVSDKAGLRPTGGVLDVSARFQSEGGVLTGAIRPVLKDGSVDAADDGLGARLKALLADVSLDLFSDDIAGRDSTATTIPIRGRVDAPQVEAVPTILGIVRNAFVAGVANTVPRELPKAKPDAGQARRPPERERDDSRPKREDG